MYTYRNNTSYGNADYQFYLGNHPLNISIKNNSRIKDFNYSIFLNKYGNELASPNEEINIPKVKPNILNYFNIAIFINFLSIYLCFYLFTSFFIEKNECVEVGSWCVYILCCEWCYCNCNSNSHSHHSNNHNYGDCNCTCDNCDCDCGDCKCDCKCDGGGGEGGAGLLLVGLIILAVIIAIAILVGLTYGIYYFTKQCGKTLSRYIVLAIVSFVNLAILVLCFLLLKNKELLIYIVMGISGSIFLINTLTMILNNVSKKPESKIYLTMPLQNLMNEEGKNATAGNYIENCPEAPFYRSSSSETPSEKNGQTIN